MIVTQNLISISILESSLGERNGRFSQNGDVHFGLNVSRSSHYCEYMLDGSNAMAAM